MRAAVMRDQKLVVDTIPDPEPGPGEVLVKTLACGICGSDLHTLAHAPELVEIARQTATPFVMDLSRDVVMGHEFCAEILDHGPGCQKTLAPGTRVCSIPAVLRANGLHGVGYSNDFPGGYAEHMVLTEGLLLPVPNGLAEEHAALTEPTAVGIHAVEMARIGSDDVALVIGCGPVGLSVIAALRLEGVAPIVAADFSPARRKLAETMGADILVDPAKNSPYEAWRDAATPEQPGETSPLDLFGPPLRPAVIFECVGVPGLIEQIMTGAARGARVVVVGVCMERDSMRPMFGINKELNLQFVFAYQPQEFSAALQHLAEGRIPVEPLITGKVGVDAVPHAFEELRDPERHAKILVEPWRS